MQPEQHILLAPGERFHKYFQASWTIAKLGRYTNAVYLYIQLFLLLDLGQPLLVGLEGLKPTLKKKQNLLPLKGAVGTAPGDTSETDASTATTAWLRVLHYCKIVSL